MTRPLVVVSLLVLCLVVPAAAQDAAREVFPSDYTPSPCAPSVDAACESFPKNRIVSGALAFRGYELHHEWVDKYWDEMVGLIKPICGAMASCFTVEANDWVYCVELTRDAMRATCERFPKGSYDRDQCTMFATAYYIGLGNKAKLHAEAQDCRKNQPPQSERTLVAWMEPAKLDIAHDDLVTVYAYDAETRIPVRARMTVEGESRLKLTEGPLATTGYPVKWTLRLPRVPNAEGHTDVVAPKMTLEAPGYQTLQMTVPVDISRMIVEMTPSPDKLKPGKNIITVTARDAVTGKPVYARVMAEDMVLGDANKPLELELTRRDKRPEIWVTSLYGHYSDVVIAKRGR